MLNTLLLAGLTAIVAVPLAAGLGVQPPHADLGLMVKENMQGLLFGSFAPLYPALCIAAVTISVNMFVDWFLKSTNASLPEEF